MKTSTVRDLRNNFKQIAAWVAAGEEVEITSRGKSVGKFVPNKPSEPWTPPTAEWLMRRNREIWGEQVRSDEEIDEMIRYARDEDS